MTAVDRLLSEFMDAWTSGRRPDVDEFLARAHESERGALADDIASFLVVAPTPNYDDQALAAIRAEPAVVAALGAADQPGGLLPSLLTSLRTRRSLTVPALAADLVRVLGLKGEPTEKTAEYVGRLESGDLEPSRVSRRIFEALGRILGVPSADLEGAGDLSGWARPTLASPAPMFRADGEAAAAVEQHLDVLADALAAPGGAGTRDEVDELFLGGR